MTARLLTATALFRFSAVMFVLFALGHTIGFLQFVAPTPEAREVFSRMVSVQFEIHGNSFSYGKFYQGFGLYITASQLFFAYFALVLGRLAGRAENFPLSLGWSFAALQFVGTILSLRYFSPPPAVFSLVLTGLLAAAAMRVRQAQSRSHLQVSSSAL